MIMEVKKWIYQELDQAQSALLQQRYRIPQLIADLFVQRGLTEDADIRAFLNPDYHRLQSPLALPDMDRAVDRIRRALEHREKITVYGDYDVDGITSVYMLTQYLRQAGAQVDYYIPDRLAEGYGIHIGALERVLSAGTKLLITVDSGITACDEVEFANRNGLDVIVTDHHECQATLPDACAVVNPKREDARCAFRDYSGAGVAFLLILALEGMERFDVLMEEYGVFATLGTVADVMPLLEDNRILVAEGLRRIAQTKNLGLRALMSEAGLVDKEITSSKIAFSLAPRINAAGRLGKAQRAVELFLSADSEKCAQMARELCDENVMRKSTEAQITEEAIAYIEQCVDLDEEKVLVVCGENWHHGVLGIVTSKITDRYHRPAILISFDEDGIGKGSGRSIQAFNLFEALSHCARLLIRYGGHEMAAGLSIDRENLEAFRRSINDYAAGRLLPEDFLPKVHINSRVAAAELSVGTYRKLCRFQPFGAGNPEPVFALTGAKIVSMHKVGMEKHLKLTLRCDGRDLDAIGFGLASYADFLKVGDEVSAAFVLSVNDYYSPPREQLVLKDLQL